MRWDQGPGNAEAGAPQVKPAKHDSSAAHASVHRIGFVVMAVCERIFGLYPEDPALRPLKTPNKKYPIAEVATRVRKFRPFWYTPAA